MAYRQKAPKQDIRDLPIKKLKKVTSKVTTDTPVISASEASTALPLFYAPKRELLRVTVISLALIILLVIALYLDMTKHWVIPFANWLLHIG